MYLARKKPFIINVPLTRCCSWLGFNLVNQLHPYVRTAVAYLHNNKITYENSPLRQYYDYFQPDNASTVLGLVPGTSEFFEKSPPSWRIYPWNPNQPEKVAAAKRKITREENSARGLSLDADHGYTVFGPVSNEKGKLEFSTLVNLVNSISKSGYIRTNRPDGDIQAIVAFDMCDNVRYFISKGHHRVAVLAALGHETIPIRVSRNLVVRQNEANKWPHVRDGLFSPEQAIEVFERVFNGQPPKSALVPEWVMDSEKQAKH
jgi:hypothetical protein